MYYSELQIFELSIVFLIHQGFQKRTDLISTYFIDVWLYIAYILMSTTINIIINIVSTEIRFSTIDLKPAIAPEKSENLYREYTAMMRLR